MLRVLANGFMNFCGAKWDAPSFIDMAYPQEEKKITAEQVIEHILLKLKQD